MNCPHQPPCPPVGAPDREAAHVVAAHPEQGWSLLCNGVVVFEDTGELLPDGRIIAPHRAAFALDLVAFCGPAAGRPVHPGDSGPPREELPLWADIG
jgi:hypothetical protein